MEFDILFQTEKILNSEKDFIVPIRKIWIKLALMGKPEKHTIEQFIFLLQNDDRFEVFENPETSIIDEEDSNLLAPNPYAGPRVMLKKRKPSRKELGDILIQKTSLIFDNLKKAWDIRNQKNEDEEDQLLQALASTQKLLRTLKKEFPESIEV